ncbi:MAG: DEAD/DEAH box helicase [Pseudomonadota bacterium]|jgi:ATP-dependent RNA helicase RhlE
MSFSSLGLREPIVRAVSERGYTQPTPIQAQAIPAVLSGGDLLAGAQTGTGKTAGFVLPILERLLGKPARRTAKGTLPIRALVLTPTRELAAQVEESVRAYGKYVGLHSMVMFGGVNINPQIARLKKPVDILVATPGRLLDHVQQKTVDLSHVEVLVLDEADRMLDMGFIHDIRRVLALLPRQRQNLLFSATFSDEIKALADSLLNRPALIEVARRNATAELVEQKVVLVSQPDKAALLAHLIKEQAWFQVLVFTRTKHRANWLAERLTKREIPALAIHGNKSQGARTRALSQFRDGSLQVLVATDIAARGLDIAELPHVVNFELPNVPEDYVHRIGRTGRAGATGQALSLVDKEEMKLLADIEKLIERRLPREEVAGFAAAPEAAVPERDARAPHGRQPAQRSAQPARGEGRRGRPAKEPGQRGAQAGTNSRRQRANGAG